MIYMTDTPWGWADSDAALEGLEFQALTRRWLILGTLAGPEAPWRKIP